MPNSSAAPDAPNQICVFSSQLKNGRFNDSTLQTLELLLVSKSVPSLLDIRHKLQTLLQSSALSVLPNLSHTSIHQKLLILQFFVRAFALSGDVESCLALKYEALVLRESCSGSEEWLKVSYEEWMTFAQDSFDNGFYSIAVKGCENALSCILVKNVVGSISNLYIGDAQVVEKIKILKDKAVALVASHSVQAQTADHLKKKSFHLAQKNGLVPPDTHCLASSAFRNGIKKQNVKRLSQLQSLQKMENGA